MTFVHPGPFSKLCMKEFCPFAKTAFCTPVRSLRCQQLMLLACLCLTAEVAAVLQAIERCKTGISYVQLLMSMSQALEGLSAQQGKLPPKLPAQVGGLFGGLVNKLVILTMPSHAVQKITILCRDPCRPHPMLFKVCSMTTTLLSAAGVLYWGCWSADWTVQANLPCRRLAGMVEMRGS